MLCAVVWCVWRCVWQAENPPSVYFNTPPCVDSKRVRIYRYTRKRFEWTHGRVLNLHTGHEIERRGGGRRGGGRRGGRRRGGGRREGEEERRKGFCVGSPNPAIHNACHASLLPSALFEPRRQSLEVLLDGVIKLTTAKLQSAWFAVKTMTVNVFIPRTLVLDR